MTNRTCSMPECDRRFLARGLCKKHYYAAGFGHTPKPCKVADCVDLTDAKSGRGWCQNHYANWRRHGFPEPTKFYPRSTEDPATVLWLRSEPHGDCVLWTGALNVDGYATAISVDGTPTRAHRFSWMLANGPIAESLTVDHLCHNRDLECADGSSCLHRRCINPDHLEIVPQSENSRRRNERERQRKAKATVVRGLAEVVAALGDE